MKVVGKFAGFAGSVEEDDDAGTSDRLAPADHIHQFPTEPEALELVSPFTGIANCEQPRVWRIGTFLFVHGMIDLKNTVATNLNNMNFARIPSKYRSVLDPATVLFRTWGGGSTDTQFIIRVQGDGFINFIYKGPNFVSGTSTMGSICLDLKYPIRTAQ